MPTEEIGTPDTPTIAALATLLGIPESRTAKAAFFTTGDNRLVFAVVRGDMEVNETKLVNAIDATEIRPAYAEELQAAGLVAGYASPIGVEGVTVVVDDLVERSPNLVAGANKPGYHLRNTNYGRDYTAEIVTDIAAAYDSAPCPVCGAAVRLVRGVEVGNIFKLGTKYTSALGATYLDEEGHQREIVMGCYGIGIGRLIGSIAQECHDERGLIWPVTLAPFHVYLIALAPDDPDVHATAETLYGELQAAGVEVLYDDRHERAGVKFNDADLLGLPLRLTISRRTLANQTVELQPRTDGNAEQVPIPEAVARVRTELRRLHDEIQARVRPEELVAV